MVDLSKLESELVERKVEDEYGRFKQRVYARKSRGKKKVDECMRIWNEKKAKNQKNEYRRLKKNAYMREYRGKLKAKNAYLREYLRESANTARKVENKKPRTVSYPTTEEVWGQREHAGSSQPLARQTAASRRTGIRSIIIQMD